MQRGVLRHFVVGHSNPGHLEYAITFASLIAWNEIIIVMPSSVVRLIRERPSATKLPLTIYVIREMPRGSFRASNRNERIRDRSPKRLTFSIIVFRSWLIRRV